MARVVESADMREIAILTLKKRQAEREILRLKVCRAVGQLFPVGLELTVQRCGIPDRVRVVRSGCGETVCVFSLDSEQERWVPFEALLEGEIGQHETEGE